MNAKRCLSLAFSVLMLGSPQPAAAIVPSSILREPVEWLLRQAGKAIGKRGVREMAEALADVGGRELAERVARRLIREGGEEALERAGRLAAKHGPDLLQAIDNAPSAGAVLRLLDELPEQEARAAVRRLAGVGGPRLIRAYERLGVSVVRAEVRHPGVGARLVELLGDDGLRLAQRLDSADAVTVAQHVDDIAVLPPHLRDGVVGLLYRDTKKMVQWMGRFVQQNPGKTLFTVATTTVLLTNPDAVLGGGEIVYDAEGNPVAVHKPSLLERIFDTLTQPLLGPINDLLRFVAVLLGLFAAAWLSIKIWFIYRVERAKSAHQSGSSKPVNG